MTPNRFAGVASRASERGARRPLARVQEWTLYALALGLPLAFDPFGVAAFEPFKVTLVRLGALVLLAGWLLSGRVARGSRLRSPARPLTLAVIAYLAAAGIASAASISPLPSFLGSSERLQGFMTLLAFAVVGRAAAQTEQPTRLVDSLLLGSVPVCGYALAQHFRLDPFNWLERTLGPASTVGSSTALGGYLAMLACLSLARAAAATRALPATSNVLALLGHPRVWRCVALLVLLALQVLVVLISGVRGALAGLGGGLGVLALLLVWRGGEHGRPRLLLGLLALGLVLILGLNLPLGPLERLRDTSPYLDRLGSISLADGTGRERLLIWRAALETSISGGPRLLVGFGPDTQTLAIERRFPLELANRLPDLRFDRVHNLMLDQLLTTGVLGLCALLALLAAVVAVGRRSLHGSPDPWFPAALIAAGAAHVIESSFAFSSASTLLVFWMTLGLVARLARGPEEGAGRGGERRTPGRASLITGGLAIAIGFSALTTGLLPLAVSPVLADMAYRRALAYQGGKDVRGEAAWLRRATLLAPDRDLYPLALGLSLGRETAVERSAGRRAVLLEEAQARLERAIALSPLDPYNHFHLGQILELRAEAEGRVGARQAAVQAYDRAAELSPSRAIFLDAAGRALGLDGRPEEALVRLRAALKLRGPEAERAAFIGDSLLALGQEDAALDSYEAALRLTPRSAPAHAGRSMLLRGRGDREGAVAEARLASRYQMRDWRYRETLAQLELEAGNRGMALIQARTAVRLAPPWEQARLRVLVEQLRTRL